jgi:two-component system alkaline phosphatase synthesis response regulator PhoP/two-component system response regulator VicR
MPLRDGHAVLEELRAQPRTEDIPCLVFTGDARFERLGKSVHRGADTFLTKPAEPREVLGLVEQLLGERR